MEYTDGTVKYNVINLVNSGGGGVLPGTIIAFSGMFDGGYPLNTHTGAADKGWHLCDGTNGTPDLRGRFILGASSSHAVGTTGGEEAHALTGSENAPHTHSASCSSAGSHTHTFPLKGASTPHKSPGAQYQDGGSSKYSATTDASGAHSHTITIGTSGNGAPHNNMPPFYTLSYIMKL